MRSLRHHLHSTILLAVFCWIGISAVLSEGFMARTVTKASFSRKAFTRTTTSTRILPTTNLNPRIWVPPGGSSVRQASSTTTPGDSGSGECPFTKFMAAFGSLWGSMGVVYILAKAIKRVLPIALEPFGASMTLSPIQWSLYALSCLFFAYAEGYKGFHLKFAPLVVKRSFTLLIGTPQGNNPLHFLLAPLYSMGLFQATPKRLKVSWGVSLGVAAIVAVVKKLPPVPRCLLDAGVVVGLTLGSISILYHYGRSILTGKLPPVDPCLPAP